MPPHHFIDNQDLTNIAESNTLYEDWLQLVQREEDPDYYVNMLLYSDEILDSIKLGTRKQEVATALNISNSKFSTILPLLIAYTRITNGK